MQVSRWSGIYAAVVFTTTQTTQSFGGPVGHKQSLRWRSLRLRVCTGQVIVDLAAEQPAAWIGWFHLPVDEGCREEADCVRVVPPLCQDLPMEVRRVDVHLVAHAKQVPLGLVANAHGQSWQIPEHVAVDRWNGRGRCYSRKPRASGGTRWGISSLLPKTGDAAKGDAADASL